MLQTSSSFPKTTWISGCRRRRQRCPGCSPDARNARNGTPDADPEELGGRPPERLASHPADGTAELGERSTDPAGEVATGVQVDEPVAEGPEGEVDVIFRAHLGADLHRFGGQLGGIAIEALDGGESMALEEHEKLGCNQSGIHTDIMFGSPEVTMVASQSRKGEVALIEQGRWVVA